MHRTAKRVMTTATATVGALALFTGTASAHYCYFMAPAGSQAAKGSAWMPASEFVPMITGELAGAQEYLAGIGTEEGDICAAAVGDVIEAANAVLETDANTLFMGPGLLAGGAIHNGKEMKKMAHLPFGELPDFCFALLGPPPA